MIKKIIFLEGRNDIDKIKKKEINIDKIISFDFDSHIKLNEEGLKHALIEDYFSDEDKELLDKKTVEFALTWYKELDKEQKLFVNKICLRELLEMEILKYFCNIIKRMIGISNIIREEKPEKIICYSLYPYLKNICKEEKIELIGEDIEIESSLYFDLYVIMI